MDLHAVNYEYIDEVFAFCLPTVTNYNNVVEANSDSDDEDKLHIVEEESVTDAADCDASVPEDDLPTDHTVLPENSERDGSTNSCWEDEGMFILTDDAVQKEVSKVKV